MTSITGPKRSLRSNTTIPSEGPSAQKLFINIRKAILNTDHPVDLTFPDIPPDAGLQITTSFMEDPDIERKRPRVSYNSLTRVLTARVQPTMILDCHQDWLSMELIHMYATGFLTIAESDELYMRVGTTMQGFAAPYASSSKEPDACIYARGLPLPTVVIQSGWPESWPWLNDEKDLWLVGGASVELMLLLRWTEISGNRVKGELHVHGKDLAGNAVLPQSESIFPAPADNVNQVVPISRAKLFGDRLSSFPDRNPGDVYDLSISNLRKDADMSIRYMGFVPAY